jgi:hypothetical protein
MSDDISERAREIAKALLEEIGYEFFDDPDEPQEQDRIRITPIIKAALMAERKRATMEPIFVDGECNRPTAEKLDRALRSYMAVNDQQAAIITHLTNQNCELKTAVGDIRFTEDYHRGFSQSYKPPPATSEAMTIAEAMANALTPEGRTQMTCGEVVDIRNRFAAIIQKAIDAAASDGGWRPIKSMHDLPEKPGKMAYEQIDCLIVYRGDVLRRTWNCEHLCWDDEEGDDFFCDPLDASHYMLTPYPPKDTP